MMNNRRIPQTLEDTILTYLKSQEAICAEDSFRSLEGSIDADNEEKVKEILEDLLLKVHKRIVCKDRYDYLKAWQNQYPLFDLNDFIIDFCVDEDIMKKLAFRETLLISILEMTCEREAEPKAVGSMCLNIQSVDASLLDACAMESDNDLDVQAVQALYKAREEIVARPGALDHSELDDMLQQKLKEYEAFLKEKMEQSMKKFVVHLSSQFNVGRNAGSNMTSWVDRNFHTLEEKRSEYIYENDGTLNEKSLYVGLQHQKYYLRYTDKITKTDERKYYKMSKACNLVCEGANFVLMRYLAITKYVGSFELSTMYINGDMCRNIYECTGPKEGIINDKTVQICKIYRYIIEECGIEHHCVTVLTTQGRIVSQEWEGCNYILNMNPLLFVDDGPPKPYEKTSLEKTWMEDMELLSNYLDCKTEAELKMETYLTDHPEVKDILADYMNNILLLKPDNILPYTMDYFQSLFPINLGRMTYFETNNDTVLY